MALTKQKLKEVLNTKQVAAFLGVSTKTIYRMEEKGLIQSIRTHLGDTDVLLNLTS